MRVSDIDIDWAGSFSEELPAGSDMQYSPEFAELETAATVTPEQQFGDVLIPAKGPEWQRVLELAISVSRQTRDLRVLLLLSRALTHLHGLSGLLQGLQALEVLLDRQWDHLHPQIIVDGASDPHVRYAVLLEFAAPEGLAGDVRQTIALRSPLGAFSVRDLERAVEQGSVEQNGIVVRREKIDDMVRDMRQTTKAAALDVPGQLVELLNRVLRTIEERLGSDFTPDLTNLKRPLERASSVLGGKPLVAADAASVDGGMSLSGSNPVGMTGGQLTSRDDVIKAMDAICTYLERHEPTNPVPLLIRRAQRLMAMNFLDIIKDMSPDGANQVMLIAGVPDEG